MFEKLETSREYDDTVGKFTWTSRGGRYRSSTQEFWGVEERGYFDTGCHPSRISKVARWSFEETEMQKVRNTE